MKEAATIDDARRRFFRCARIVAHMRRGSERVNRRVEFFVAGGLMAALVISAAACKHPKQELPAASTGTQQAAPQWAPVSGRQQRIAAMRQLVDRDPGNAKGWVALGDEYFDSEQRAKAIEAYGKALQLEPNNPDVLTDQGVMYRELGSFDKAIANFKKANTIDPKHLPSLLDLGVLYAQDLKDQDKAVKTWNSLIRIAPMSPQAMKAQAYIDQLKQIPKPK
jgi:cytochrome c-type biogenesis protein CcmH/NrfG